MRLGLTSTGTSPVGPRGGSGHFKNCSAFPETETVSQVPSLAMETTLQSQRATLMTLLASANGAKECRPRAPGRYVSGTQCQLHVCHMSFCSNPRKAAGTAPDPAQRRRRGRPGGLSFRGFRTVSAHGAERSRSDAKPVTHFATCGGGRRIRTGEKAPSRLAKVLGGDSYRANTLVSPAASWL
jgi:hypothetical protein